MIKISFKPKLANLNLKLSRVTSLFYRVKDIVPNNIMKKVLWCPHTTFPLLYSIPIWCTTNILPLFRKQKRLIRIITDSDFYKDTQPYFKKVHKLKLKVHTLKLKVHTLKILMLEIVLKIYYCSSHITTILQAYINTSIYQYITLKHFNIMLSFMMLPRNKIGKKRVGHEIQFTIL